MEAGMFIGGLPAASVVIVGYAAILVALGVVCEALGAEEEKAFPKAVLKQLRTIGAAGKAIGGMAAAGAATYAMGTAKELQPFGWWIGGGMLVAVAVAYALIAWRGSKSVLQNSSNQIAANANSAQLECSICGHSVATVHTVSV